MKSLPLILALALSTTAQAGVDIQRWTTGNGTEVLLVEQHDNPIVDMQVNFKGAGSVFNPRRQKRSGGIYRRPPNRRHGKAGRRSL